MKNRKNLLKNKINICPYCGSFVNIYLSSVIHNLDNYWEIIMALPSVKIPNKNITLLDRRVNNIKAPLLAKDFRMTKDYLINTDLNKKRIRYTISNRNYKSFILDGVLICDCSKTISFDSKIFCAVSNKPHIGYNQALSYLRHNIINHFSR